MKIVKLTLLLGLINVIGFSQNKESGAPETDLSLRTKTGTLYGTLSVPESQQPIPVVLIIPGSGPTDRNGNAPVGLKTNSYKMLSEGLAASGIASVRFDKRGIGQSKAGMGKEADLRFETYVDDVKEWVVLLQADHRFSQVYLLGHSEGSLIGMIAANQKAVAGFISISGPGQTADKILQQQLRNKLPMPLLIESNTILESLRSGQTVTDVNPKLATLYRPSVQPYLISWMKYDPALEIKKLKIPMLIIQGTTDLQVGVEDAKMLSESNLKARLMLIEGMNHVLKTADADELKNMATYGNPSLPLHPSLVDNIVSFITQK